MPCQNSEERGGNRWNRTEQTFRIVNPALPPDVLAQDHAIYKRREASFLAEISGRVSGRRELRHDQAVADEQRDGDQQLRSDFGGQKNQRRHQVTDRDTLEDTGDADRR